MKMRRRSRIARAALLLACGQAFLMLTMGSSGAQGPQRGQLPCLGGGGARGITPIEYTVAYVHQGSERNALKGIAAVFVKDDAQRVLPMAVLGGQRSPFAVVCEGREVQGQNLFPNAVLTPKNQGPGSPAALLNYLVLAAGDGDLRSWNAIAFRSTAGKSQFMPWPGGWQNQQGMGSTLVESYLKEKPTYLNGYSDVVETLVTLAEKKRVFHVSTPTAPGGPSVEGSPTAGSPPAPVAAAEQPAGVDQNTPFTIGFRQKPMWQDIKLNEDNRIETFGYCRSDIDRPNPAEPTYVLHCAAGKDGKVPIRIRGFKELSIGAREMALDERLEVAGFGTPYPQNWDRSVSDFVTVSPGRLSDILNRALDVDQGIAGVSTCVDKTNPITVAAIIEQRLGFPEPPCRWFELKFPPRMTDASSLVQSDCLAGAPASVPIRNDKVTCWYHRRQQFPLVLKLQLATGFEPVPIQIAAHNLQQTAEFTFEGLAPYIKPLWPYDEVTPFEADIRNGNAPQYKPRTIEYLERNQPCGTPVAFAAQSQGGTSMPTLEAAGCHKLPTDVRITFERTGGDSPDGPPRDAFKETHPDTYSIASIARGKRGRLPVDDLKVILPVGFGRGVIADYDRRFGAGAGNAAYPGVSVFTGDCGRMPEGRYVKFTERKGEFRWPVFGAVYDGKVDEPLTLCAKATVERSDDNKPYLTFKLEPSRAAGPRRVVVIAKSQNFARQPGTSQALTDALTRLVDAAADAKKRGAALSPITVYSVNGESTYSLLFNGEQAASNPEAVKKRLLQIDQAAPPTPDFQSISFQPEVKNNLEKIIMVMDGSAVSQGNKAQLALLVLQLAKDNPNNVAFYVTSNRCEEWRSNLPPFTCTQLVDFKPGPGNALVKALIDLVNPPDNIAQDGAGPRNEPPHQQQPGRPKQ